MKWFWLLLPLTLHAENLIEGYRFTDIRSRQPLEMPVVDAQRVEGYEILYATPGTGDIAEIAGHLLLRVKLRDLPDEQDLVLSFLADTGDVPNLGNIEIPLSECRKRNWLNLLQSPAPDGESPWTSITQSLRGLSGGFPVTMDIQTLGYTLKSYTVEQDRNLLRYELKLSEKQRNQLTQTLIAYPDRDPLYYFFFHRNCGSVLVQVLGEGIDDADISGFRPWVSPPHALCALLIREGVAARAYPDFHSTRTRGDLYRQAFKASYPHWVADAPDLPWPAAADFLSPNTNTRLLAVQQLEAVLTADPSQASRLLALGPLLQQMELSTDVRDGHCRDVTSPVTTQAREFQVSLMQKYPVIEPEEIFPDQDPLNPPPPSKPGSDHTRLFALEAGVGWLDNRPAGKVSGVLLQQDMGSRSALAMQRAGALVLGKADILFDKETVQEWGVTALSLRKFRERLGSVPSGLRSTHGWGMELSVLDLQSRSIGPDLQGSVAGAGGWLNLISAPGMRHYLMLGAGSNFGWVHDGRSDWGFTFPIQAESLITLGNWQWRNRGGWIGNQIENLPEQLFLKSDLAVPLGEWGKTEVILHAGLDWLQTGDEQRTLGLISFEFNRW